MNDHAPDENAEKKVSSASSDTKRRTTSEGVRPHREGLASQEGRGGATRPARSSDSGTSRQNSSGDGPKAHRLSAAAAVKKALEQFRLLTSRTPESVVGVQQDDDGWRVRLEVVESRRIPDSADLLAEYEVELDGRGDIVAYDRKDRYVRGRPSG